MKRGDVVWVYEDPIQEKKPEGKAKLLELLDTDNDGILVLRRWRVRFPGDDGGSFERTIRDHAAEQKQRRTRIRKRLESTGLY